MSEQIFPEWRSFLGTNESASVIKNVVKRSGEIEKYNPAKISAAINKAIEAVEKTGDLDRAKALTDEVENKLKKMIDMYAR